MKQKTRNQSDLIKNRSVRQDNMKRNTLWIKDFTLITVGTIGGTAMSFALGIVVVDNTTSTGLTDVFLRQ